MRRDEENFKPDPFKYQESLCIEDRKSGVASAVGDSSMQLRAALVYQLKPSSSSPRPDIS